MMGHSAVDKPLIPVNFQGIPDELKERPQWVVWRYELRDGKPTKVPYIPGAPSVKAESNDLMTWGRYEEALWTYENWGVDGIGFVFSSADPYTAVDLDDVRDPETGQIETRAWQVIEALDGFTEISPSGMGIHVIVRGKLRESVSRDWCQIWSAGKYLSMTGVKP